jgi:hypothetical protein
MQGREIDMEAMRAKNELTVAVGNVNINARGDQLKGGRIVKSRDQVVAEYYETNPNATPRQNLVNSNVIPQVENKPEVTKRSRSVNKLAGNNTVEEKNVD